MSEGRRFYDINVICSHSATCSSEKPRLLCKISWEDNEQWLIDMVQRRVDEGELDVSGAEMIRRHERFTTWGSRLNRARKPVKPPVSYVRYPLETGAAARAGALSGWRFKCDEKDCTVDRPVRQDKMEAWLLTEAERDTRKTRFTFDAAQYR